jgi:hypothetical protein
MLLSKKVKTPVAVCFDNTSMPGVFIAEGLPISSLHKMAIL